MKLYRYCSAWEYENFIAGRSFRNTQPYNGCGIQGVFWFFPTRGMTLRQIKDNLHQLSGIVVAERLMILEFDDDYFIKNFGSHKGRYIARGVPDDDWSMSNIEIREEYYTKKYNRKNAKLLDAYAIDFGAYMNNEPNGKVFTRLLKLEK